MSTRIGEHIRSNVVTYLVIFLAITVVPAYAAIKIPKNSVGTKQIKNGAVTNPKLATGAVDASKVAPNSLTGGTIDEAALDSSILQRRIGTGCSASEAIRQVNSDGTVVCETVGGGGAPTGPAGGDLTGTYPDPQIAALAVTTAKLADGAVSTGKLGDGQVTIPKLAFDPATQAELDTHKSSADHDSRYFTESELSTSDGDPPNVGSNRVHWNNLNGVPGGFADGIDDAAPSGPAGGDLTGTYPNPQIAALAVTTAKLADGAVSTGKLGDGQVTIPKLAFDPATQAELDALATPGTINQPSNPVDWTKLKNVPAGFADGADSTGNDWSLNGNTLTNPVTDFIGTTDNTAFNVRVNNQRALRIEPDATSPILIGGSSANSVTPGAFGATVSGGGATGSANAVTDRYGTVAGGQNNRAGNNDGNAANAIHASVGGGNFNIASAQNATVGGGTGNNATNASATIGGGQANNASGTFSTVVGGNSNSVSGSASTAAGGIGNSAAGDASFVAGSTAQNSNAAHDGVFLFSDSTGLTFNSAAANEFAVRASGGYRLFSSGDTTGANAPGLQIPASSSALATKGTEAFEVRPGGSRALRIEPTSGTPNIIGGSPGNSVLSGVKGATISGGNSSVLGPTVSDDAGTVGGGLDNRAGNNAGTPSDSVAATVAGGNINTASGAVSSIGGGNGNTASGDSSTIPGGLFNQTAGDYSFAAGRRAQNQDPTHDGVFLFADSNTALANFTSVAANEFAVRASGGYRLFTSGDTTGANAPGLQIPSGSSSLATRGSQPFEVLPGGDRALRIEPKGATPSPNLIGGFSGNNTTASAFGAVIAGGGESGNTNRVTDHYGVVGGGINNQAGDGAGTVADRDFATVGGGILNTASGEHSTVPGGSFNIASGQNSFAAGGGAQATDNSSFVWSDANGPAVSTGANSFTSRASGGYTLYTAAGTGTGAQLPSGSGSWSTLSDENVKDDITPVRGEDVLAALKEMPISTWRYEAEPGNVTHIGPMAQDFAKAFGVGPDRRHISSVDADGVALAAIKGLDEKVEALQAGSGSGSGTSWPPVALIAVAMAMLAVAGALGAAVALRYAGRGEGRLAIS